MYCTFSILIVTRSCKSLGRFVPNRYVLFSCFSMVICVLILSELLFLKTICCIVRSCSNSTLLTISKMATAPAPKGVFAVMSSSAACAILMRRTRHIPSKNICFIVLLRVFLLLLKIFLTLRLLYFLLVLLVDVVAGVVLVAVGVFA